MVGTHYDFATVIDLCGHEHRRIVLATLTEGEGAFSVQELVERVARHNHHVQASDLPEATTKKVETGLHHAHLPKLAAAGVLDYDATAGRVERTDGFADLQPHLSAILDADPVLAMPLSS